MSFGYNFQYPIWHRWVAIAHFSLACAEADVLNKRYTDTVVPEAILVAQYWRSWLTFMCIFNFMISVLFFLYSLQSTQWQVKIIRYAALPALFVASKIRTESWSIAVVVIWLAGLWLIVPIITLLFWFPNPQGMWQPGCALYNELCNPAIWSTLEISNIKALSVMYRQYGQRQSCLVSGSKCVPLDSDDQGPASARCSEVPYYRAGENCDPYFGLGFVGVTVFFELTYAVISLLWFLISSCSSAELIKAMVVQLRSLLKQPLLGIRISQAGLTKIEVAVKSMVRRRSPPSVFARHAPNI
jgi:hypothetical protein